ncbi:MAG TPA: hypothetical protein VI455_05980, partial [Terriglobia bacterium]
VLGSFFKVVSEAWTSAGFRNIMFVVVGPPHIPEEIAQGDPSAPRIFSYVQLNRMTEEESLSLLQRCLEGTEKHINDDAARQITRWAQGFPYFLHQLGYDAFQADNDDVIDQDDAVKGFAESMVQLERMLFGRIYDSVAGKQKQKIVDEISRAGNSPREASELQKTLRIKNIHQYFKSLQLEGVIDKTPGGYRISSDLLAVFFNLKRVGSAPNP